MNSRVALERLIEACGVKVPAMPEGPEDAQKPADYTDWLTGARKFSQARPYPGRNRQCSIGYHDECSDPAGEGCECPCHAIARVLPDAVEALGAKPKLANVSKNLNWKHCTDTPRVVTLCGSTRFMDQFFKSGWEETLAGRIVLSVGVVIDDGEAAAQLPNDHLGEHFGVKDLLDELHFRKIDLSDEILVLNLDGYIGKHTQREIAYALATRKTVRFLDEEAGERVTLEERYNEIERQILAFEDGQVAPLCVWCNDTGEMFDVVPGEHGEGEEVHGPCSRCDATGGARAAKDAEV